MLGHLFWLEFVQGQVFPSRLEVDMAWRKLVIACFLFWLPFVSLWLLPPAYKLCALRHRVKVPHRRIGICPAPQRRALVVFRHSFVPERGAQRTTVPPATAAPLAPRALAFHGQSSIFQTPTCSTHLRADSSRTQLERPFGCLQAAERDHGRQLLVTGLVWPGVSGDQHGGCVSQRSYRVAWHSQLLCGKGSFCWAWDGYQSMVVVFLKRVTAGCSL